MTTCAVDGCENEAKKAGVCWGHMKQRQLGKPMQPLEVPKQKRNTPDALREAAIRFADVSAEDDGEFRLVDRGLFETARNYVRRDTSEKIREAIAARREAGLPHGGQVKPVPESELELLRIGEARVVEVAARLGVSRVTVWRRRKVSRT